MRFLQRVTKNIVRSEKQGIIMLNKMLCGIWRHNYEFSGLVPTGDIDPCGCPTYRLIATHKCKHCGRVKKWTI